MNRNLKWWGLGGVLAAAALFAMNLPANAAGDEPPYGLYEELMKSCVANAKKDCEGWAKEGGGGAMPHGLKADTKVELAIGENYILTGLIDIRKSDVLLKIDLHEQPWLANRARLRNPYYRISGDPAGWTKYRGKTITIVGTSRYSVYSNRGKTMFEIYIEPAAQPVLEALQRARR